MSKHKFMSLRPGVEDEWSGAIGVQCCETKRRMAWNDACRAGWVADLNGKPFYAYYSPEGLQIAKNREASHV